MQKRRREMRVLLFALKTRNASTSGSEKPNGAGWAEAYLENHDMRDVRIDSDWPVVLLLPFAPS